VCATKTIQVASGKDGNGSSELPARASQSGMLNRRASKRYITSTYLQWFGAARDRSRAGISRRCGPLRIH
jgi:hypothetical protein